MMKRPVLSAVAEIARRAERTGWVGECTWAAAGPCRPVSAVVRRPGDRARSTCSAGRDAIHDTRYTIHGAR
jgi:hypothetical protein